VENRLKYNLFEYATTELSHSALWAWILRSADSQSDRYKLAKRIALSFFRSFVDNSFNTGSAFTVKREYCPLKGSKPMIDVYVAAESEGKRRIIVIENKLKDVISSGQIESIQTSFSREDNVTYIFLNAAYDVMLSGLWEDINDTVRVLTKFKSWTFVGVERIIHLLNEFVNEMGQSPIIADYYDWLIYKSKYYSMLEDKAFSANYEDVAYALGKPEGQWFFMKSVFSGVNGIQYNGNNTGGTPWTQFRFFQLSKEDPEYERFRGSIFYRIDRTKIGGYYLRLNTYHGDGMLEHEKQALDELRVYYRNLMNSIPLESKTVDSYYNKKENIIGEVLIGDNPPSEMKTQMPVFHEQLKRLLISKGWPERGFLNFVQG
jgi:hypothetical protein